MTTQKHNNDFQIRILYEQQIIENIGISLYICQLLDRRWADESLDGFIFAIPRMMNTKLIPNANPIGNDDFFCTIIMVDPNKPTVLVIMNQLYSFVSHCLASEQNESNYNISIIADNIQSINIITMSYNLFTYDNITKTAHISQNIAEIVMGIIAICGAEIINQSKNGFTIDYIIRSINPYIALSRVPCDFCAISQSPVARQYLCPSSLWCTTNGSKSMPNLPRFRSPRILHSFLPIRSSSSCSPMEGITFERSIGFNILHRSAELQETASRNAWVMSPPPIPAKNDNAMEIVPPFYHLSKSTLTIIKPKK